MNLLARHHLETNNILRAVGYELVYLFARHRQRVAHLHARLSVILEVFYLLTLSLKLLWSVESDIGLSAFQQLVYILTINLAALALTVRAMTSSEGNTLVEFQSEPSECLKDIFLCARHKPVGVSILNAENKISVMLTCKEIIIQRRTHTTDVERACWTWCKTHTNFSFCHIFQYIKSVI